jgi:hypothetical protein
MNKRVMVCICFFIFYSVNVLYDCSCCNFCFFGLHLVSLQIVKQNNEIFEKLKYKGAASKHSVFILKQNRNIHR